MKIGALADATDTPVETVRELRALEMDLKALRACCCTFPRAVAECGILDGIDRAVASSPAVPPRTRHVHGAH